MGTIHQILCGFLALLLSVCTATAGEELQTDCLDCHADESIEAESDRGRGLALVVVKDALAGSVHEDLACTDCHVGAKDWEEAPHNGGKPLSLACGSCHEKAKKDYEGTCVHGRARSEGQANAPWCSDCHGGHKILPLESEDSVLSHRKQPKTCGKCHQSDQVSPEGHIAKRLLVERYYSSVHWRSVKEGKPAATCSDCHGTHCVLPSSEEGSHVSRVGLLAACARCHQAIVQTYSKGSHGRTLLNGNLDVPTCVTCHGDHDVMSLKTQAGGTRNFAGTQICIWCHGNERMMARYALDTSPVDSYMRDFHGLTQRGTAGTSATCADCHDPHHSLPSSHPESRMHLSNRGTACGKCHGKISDSFIMSFTHRTAAMDQGGPVKNVVTWIYLILIFGTIGLMLLHNAVIWAHAARQKRRYQKAHGHIERLNRFERLWHWMLLVSFLVLVLTGFALKYPESVVFGWMYTLGLTEGARSWIHRLAAVVQTVSMGLIIVYQIVSPRGRRKWLFGMLPRLQDIKDLFANMAYHLGRRKQRPRTAVFSYVEKAEYWALLWGVGVMVLTGLVLWFPKWVPDSWPAWLIEVARLIHFYEAILASLAILVWHGFHVFFKPAEYPMDTAWLTGMLTEREAKHRFTVEAIEAQLPPPPQERIAPEAPEDPEWAQEHTPADEAKAPESEDSKKED